MKMRWFPFLSNPSDSRTAVTPLFKQSPPTAERLSSPLKQSLSQPFGLPAPFTQGSQRARGEGQSGLRTKPPFFEGRWLSSVAAKPEGLKGNPPDSQRAVTPLKQSLRQPKGCHPPLHKGGKGKGKGQGPKRPPHQASLRGREVARRKSRRRD